MKMKQEQKQHFMLTAYIGQNIFCTWEANTTKTHAVSVANSIKKDHYVTKVVIKSETDKEPITIK